MIKELIVVQPYISNLHETQNGPVNALPWRIAPDFIRIPSFFSISAGRTPLGIWQLATSCLGEQFCIYSNSLDDLLIYWAHQP
jgi:hypothetical protein